MRSSAWKHFFNHTALKKKKASKPYFCGSFSSFNKPLVFGDYEHVAIVQSYKADGRSTQGLSSRFKFVERTLREEVALSRPTPGSLGENPEGPALLLLWQGCKRGGQEL